MTRVVLEGYLATRTVVLEDGLKGDIVVVVRLEVL